MSCTNFMELGLCKVKNSRCNSHIYNFWVLDQNCFQVSWSYLMARKKWTKKICYYNQSFPTRYPQQQWQKQSTSVGPAYLISFVFDHLLQAAYYVQVPIWIEVSSITRSQPAIVHCMCILIIQVTCDETILQNPNTNEQIEEAFRKCRN
jgi:hypothetical protein